MNYGSDGLRSRSYLTSYENDYSSLGISDRVRERNTNLREVYQETLEGKLNSPKALRMSGTTTGSRG